MFNAIKPLLDSGLINESVSQELTEAWESKLTEARETIRAELREEFAQRYNQDKSVMVEALDRMVTEGLNSEVQALYAEKQALVEDRVKFHSKMSESATKFNGFLVTKLAEEISELRSDRKNQNSTMTKLESFVMSALAEEISEFAKDKRELVEAKVRLVSEARNKLETLKARFIKESAVKMSQAVSKHLTSELTQLQEDIKVARENNFGRRIFEAYATEFGATHLNENAEIRKLSAVVANKDKQLAEAAKTVKNAKIITENKEKELRILKESNQRETTMEDLLAPLNAEKRAVMRDLLESVQTTRLTNAFEKYLPAVLANKNVSTPRVLTESVSAVTGNKSVKVAMEDRGNVIDLKRLAGL
jgi:hypothetical protein